jgi:hypothetical protein
LVQTNQNFQNQNNSIKFKNYLYSYFSRKSSLKSVPANKKVFCSKKPNFSTNKIIDTTTVLPPIENDPEKVYLKKSFDSSSVTSSSSDLRASFSASLKNSPLLSNTQQNILKRNPSSESENIELLPKTENKKRAPNKIRAIDPIVKQLHKSTTLNRNFQEPIIIDILSESGRFSKQSLDPLTNRESLSTKSSVIFN